MYHVQGIFPPAVGGKVPYKVGIWRSVGTAWALFL